MSIHLEAQLLGPCRWPYLITQQWVRYNISISLGPIGQMSLAQTSLQLTLTKPSDQPDSSPWIEKLWANAMLFDQPMSNYITPKPQDEL